MHEQVKPEQPSTAYVAVVTYKSGEKTLAMADDEGRLVTQRVRQNILNDCKALMDRNVIMSWDGQVRS